jgi:hypothetical protein
MDEVASVMEENQTQFTPDEQHLAETFHKLDEQRQTHTHAADVGERMTEEDARAIMRVIAEDKRLPQPKVDEAGNFNVTATRAEAEEIARRVWWKTKLFSPEGLAHLFPGLKVPKVRRGALPRAERKAQQDNQSNPSSAPRKASNRAARRRAARLASQNPSV